MSHRVSERSRSRRAFATRPLAIVYRGVEELRLDPANPRLHSGRQIKQIARSIEAFGFSVPILIDANNQVIAGHGRLQACKQLGIRQVPTICLEHLNEIQARAFMIADNRLTENSEWNERLLAEQIKILADVELDFNLEAIGFEMAEIDLMIESIAPASKRDDAADLIPDAPGSPRISRYGDLWQLGRHRILCGSALEESSFESLLQDRRTAMVFSDPPYNVPIAGHATGLGKIHHREFEMASGEMTEGEFTDFLFRVASHLAAHSEEGSLHYICMDWRHIGELLAAGRRAYSELKNVCVWTKDNAGMGSLYRSRHEFIFVFKNGTAPHRNNVELGRFGRNRSNVWNYPGANSFSRQTEEGNLLALHPTIKPAALVAAAILAACSMKGDVKRNTSALTGPRYVLLASSPWDR